MEKYMLWAMLFLFAGFGSVDSVTNVGSGCYDAKMSTGSTVYRANLRTLLTSLATNAPLQNGFVNTSVGDNSDRVYGLAWCRADVSPDSCSECLNRSIKIPLRECPESKSLVIWSSLCSLRFSNESFFGNVLNTSSFSSYGQHGLDDAAVFLRGFSMMEALGRNASNQSLMFATSAIDVGRNEERYGMAQCSRDLSKLDCEDCLERLLTSHQRYVWNRAGWEMVGVNCGLWYDDIRFYDNNSGLTPTANTSGSGERRYKRDQILAFVALLVFYLIP